MAALSVIFGGMAGLVSALIGWGLFGLSLLQGLGLWSLVGLGLATALVGMAQLQRPQAVDLDLAHA